MCIQWKKIMAILINGVVVSYVSLLAGWFAAWLIVGDGTWWLILLNRIVPYMFIPGLLLLLSVLVARKFRLLFLLSVPGIIFLILYYPYVLPTVVAEKPSDLSVMTYNVQYKNFNYDAVANVILTYHPDLVALQEVQPAMMEFLEAHLKDVYPYSMMGEVDAYGTTAVFSQHPLQSAYMVDLQAGRPALVIKTEVKGVQINFLTAHLWAFVPWGLMPEEVPESLVRQTFTQNRQARLLIEEVSQQQGITIVGCDCNSNETSGSQRILATVMQNTAREVGWRLHGSRLRNAKPDRDLLHIDYVFYRGQLSPVGMYTIQDSGGSDHFPVLALFRFN